jgi:hypothetical protein
MYVDKHKHAEHYPQYYVYTVHSTLLQNIYGTITQLNCVFRNVTHLFFVSNSTLTGSTKYVHKCTLDSCQYVRGPLPSNRCAVGTCVPIPVIVWCDV